VPQSGEWLLQALDETLKRDLARQAPARTLSRLQAR